MSNLSERLKEMNKELEDWEKRKTSVEGVEISKLKSKKKGDDINLSLVVTPIDNEGKPLKRKGVYVTSLEQWESFKEIFNNEKALELIQAIDKLKAKPEQEQKKESEEVFKL